MSQFTSALFLLFIAASRLCLISSDSIASSSNLRVEAKCLSSWNTIQLFLKCPINELIHVHHAYYGRGVSQHTCRHTRGSCHDMDNSRQAQCDGREFCEIQLQPVTIKSCAHGNSSTFFQLVYECIPSHKIDDICLASARPALHSQTGYLTSPGFPRHHPGQRQCTVRLRLPRFFSNSMDSSHQPQKIRVTVLYMTLECSAGAILRINDPYGLSWNKCNSIVQRHVFTSVGPKLDISFDTGDDHAYPNNNEDDVHRGFWLHYEAIPLVVYRDLPSAPPMTNKQISSVHLVNTDEKKNDLEKGLLLESGPLSTNKVIHYPNDHLSASNPAGSTNFVSDATLISSRAVIGMAVITAILVLMLAGILGCILFKKMRVNRHYYNNSAHSQSFYSSDYESRGAPMGCTANVHILNNNLCANISSAETGLSSSENNIIMPLQERSLLVMEVG